MTQAHGGDLGPVLGLGQDKSALDHGLGEKGQTLGTPRGLGDVTALGIPDVLGHSRGMGTNVPVTGLADRRVCVVSLLRHEPSNR